MDEFIYRKILASLEIGDSFQVRRDKYGNVFWKVDRAKSRIDKWVLFSALFAWGLLAIHLIGELVNG